MSEITTFRARKIITMDHNRPEATHVAVRDGRILAVGTADDFADWGSATRDDRYGDKVILPGLVEAHAHVMAGGIWRYVYCGHYARTDPDGRVWDGVTTNDAVAARLSGARGQGPVVGWGFDPGFITGPRLSRHDLDAVASDRPVVLVHSNFHLLTANSAALKAAGIDRGTNIAGVVKDAEGDPTGEMQEFEAMGPLMAVAGVDFAALTSDADGLRAYGQVARQCGVTTVADLLSVLDDGEIGMALQVTGDPRFPVRYVPIMNAMTMPPEEAAARARAIAARSTDKLRLGFAKLFTDGAIQGRTAMLKWPGYFTGADHGMMNMEEGHFRRAVEALHVAGVKMHIHTNGDAASELATDALEAAMRKAPWPDHRHTLEHVQLADRAQFRRMKALGLCVNIFSNHLYYFGDIHWAVTLGPDRARRMDAAADALDIFGGDFAIHSDAPVTPMAPLFTAWCAVNRLTAEGRRLGASQAIPVAAALRCITLGAAHVLKLEREIGSIECGKRADFAVLDDDPLSVDPLALRDIGVHATVLAGQPTA
jgi:predicted amidohydrolase YtcJ